MPEQKWSAKDKRKLISLVIGKGMTVPAALEETELDIPEQTVREWVARARVDGRSTGDLEQDAETAARECVYAAMIELEIIKQRQAEGHRVSRDLSGAASALKHARAGLEAVKARAPDPPSPDQEDSEQPPTGPSDLERTIQSTSNGKQADTQIATATGVP